jgi:hypothetical protein
MKIAAYILAVLNALIWAVLTMLAANFLRWWWNYDGVEPFSGNNLIAAIMVMLPPTGLVIVVSSAFFLRQRVQRFFFASCALTVATFAGGLAFLGFYGAGV